MVVLSFKKPFAFSIQTWVICLPWVKWLCTTLQKQSIHNPNLRASLHTYSLSCTQKRMRNDTTNFSGKHWKSSLPVHEQHFSQNNIADTAKFLWHVVISNIQTTHIHAVRDNNYYLDDCLQWCFVLSSLCLLILWWQYGCTSHANKNDLSLIVIEGLLGLQVKCVCAERRVGWWDWRMSVCHSRWQVVWRN